MEVSQVPFPVSLVPPAVSETLFSALAASQFHLSSGERADVNIWLGTLTCQTAITLTPL